MAAPFEEETRQMREILKTSPSLQIFSNMVESAYEVKMLEQIVEKKNGKHKTFLKKGLEMVIGGLQQEKMNFDEKLKKEVEKRQKTEKMNLELFAQIEAIQQEKIYMELELKEGKSDSELHFACLHAPITVSLGDNLREMQRATEKKNKFLSKVLTKVTASRNELLEIFMKINGMTKAAGLGYCNFTSVMGSAEQIEGNAIFEDLQAGVKRTMADDWARIGKNLREKFAEKPDEVVKVCFEKRLVNQTTEMGTQTNPRVGTERVAKAKKWKNKKKQEKLMKK